MTKTVVTTLLGAAAMLSGTAAFAATAKPQPHAPAAKAHVAAHHASRTTTTHVTRRGK